MLIFDAESGNRTRLKHDEESLSIWILTSSQPFPRAYLLGGDVMVYVCAINQPSLPTPFYSVLVSISVFMALSTVFHLINSPDNFPFFFFFTLFFRSYLSLIGPLN